MRAKRHTKLIMYLLVHVELHRYLGPNGSWHHIIRIRLRIALHVLFPRTCPHSPVLGSAVERMGKTFSLKVWCQCASPNDKLSYPKTVIQP